MRRPTPRQKTPEPTPSITRQDQYWSGVYFDMIQRHQMLPLNWHVALTAVRLYAKRHGFDVLLDDLKREGVPVVAEKCRHELTLRQEFFARMLAANPPPDPREAEGAYEEIAEDLAMIDSPEGGLLLLRYLDRVLRRELWLDQSKMVH